MTSIRGWLTTLEAAQLTGYNVEYIRRLVRAKKIVATKWGRDWIVQRSSLLGYRDAEKLRGSRSKGQARGRSRQLLE